MTAFTAVQQSASPGAKVELYTLDATPISAAAGIYHFVQATDFSVVPDQPIVFGGVSYQPADVAIEGMEMNGTGSLPTPRVKIGNANQVVQALVNTYGDLLGCIVTRVRTFDCFLDNGSTPDSTAHLPPDVFRVERKANENKFFIEWELAASIDQEGRRLPGRTIIRDYCPFRYRTWNGTTFVYSLNELACPYTGSAMARADDVVTTDHTLDFCGRRITSCKARFPTGALPFGGFPGAARVH